MEFKEHVKRLRTDAWLFLILFIASVVFIALSIELFFDGNTNAVAFIIITAVFLLAFVVQLKRINLYERTVRENVEHFVVGLNNNLTYDEVHACLLSRAENEESFEFADGAAFFRLRGKYIWRTILFFGNDFNKEEFVRIKSKINRRANKLYDMPQNIPLSKARKLMRLNVIFTENMNAELQRYINADTTTNLGRVEGTINVVICENNIVVPPLYSTVSLFEIERYRRSVNMLVDLLRKP